MSQSEKGRSFRVLVADPIAEAGVELLRQTPGFEVAVRTGLDPQALRAALQDYDALIVRSTTKVTREVLRDVGRLRAIGRAGTGVDNIDLEAATAAGVVVMNTPGGNAVAAAEHTIALMLALARNIPRAHADLREGRWERKPHTGTELAGKTLGVVGLGRIGQEVVRRAQALQMQVIGYDPYVSQDAAARMGVEPASLEALLERSDVVTLHVPLTEETHHLLDAQRLSRMKRGARLVNCARGGLVDEAALYQALAAGHLAGAALDVFEEEPPTDLRLVRHPNVVATPHLGASTVEAQERVAIEIAQKIRDFLASGVVLDALNFPSIPREAHAALVPLMDLTERLARFLAQIAEGGFCRLELRCYGEFLERPLEPLVMAAAKGLLSPMLDSGVSAVNALCLARQRGIAIEEGRSNEATPYSGLVRLTLVTDRGSFQAAGTLFGPSKPKLVEVEGLPIECTLEGRMLFLRNRDVPGVVGKIGTLLGSASVNIAGIHLGRLCPGADAVSIISVDNPVPPSLLQQIRNIPEIVRAKLASLETS